MQQVALPDCPPPHYALAHSTGGLVCLAPARSGRIRFTRMVLAAPLIGLGRQRPSQGMIQFGTGLVSPPSASVNSTSRSRMPRRCPGQIRGQSATRPTRSALPATVAIYKQLPQASDRAGRPSAGSTPPARRWQRRRSRISRPSINVPIADRRRHAGHRRLGRARSRRWSESSGPALWSILPGARHELMMERDRLREQFWAAFDAFVPGSSSPVCSSCWRRRLQPALSRSSTCSCRRGSPQAAIRPPDAAELPPGRNPATGALDDRDQRDDVVALEPGLDDEVGLAGADHAIGVAVDAIAGEPDRLLDPLDRRARRRRKTDRGWW